jgi:hypothetical protein
MILFYSDTCNHCNMLLDMVKKNNTSGLIKCVHIDNIRKTGMNIESKIHSIPALYLIEKKEFLFGKKLFDYLLLPNSGILHKKGVTSSSQNNNSTPPIVTNGVSDIESGPAAFSIKSNLSDNFHSVDEEDNTTEKMHSVLNDKNYNWSLITENSQHINTGPVEEKSDEGKKLPSIEHLLKQRELDIQ